MVSRVFDHLKEKVVKPSVHFTAKLIGKQPLNRIASIKLLEDAVVYQKQQEPITLSGKESLNGFTALFFEPGRCIEFEPNCVWQLQRNKFIKEINICRSGSTLINRKHLLDMDFGTSAAFLELPYKPKHIEYPYIIAPWSHFWCGYYDFIVLLLAKLCRIENALGKDIWHKAKICYPLLHTHYERQFLEKLGIPETSLINTRPWNLEIQAASVVLANNQNWFFPIPYDLELLQNRFCQIEYNDSSARKLFISREGRRRVKNEAEVREVLKKFDFEIVEEQERSVDEQIRLFREASVVVGPHGGGLANLVWCRPGTQVIEFFDGGYTTPFYYYICTVLGFKYSYFVDTSIHKEHGNETQNMSFDMTVDVEILRKELKRIFG